MQKFHPILEDQYYINSLKYLLQGNQLTNTNMKIIYFYETKDKELVDEKINILKLSFPDNEFFSIDNILEDWEQLLIMSLCKYNIIANSTFSWWAAYFNTNVDKKVCYPSLWFGELKNHLITNDLFPEDWIKIEV